MIHNSVTIVLFPRYFCLVNTKAYLYPPSALLDPVYYSYVLNGDGKQAQTKNFAFGGAWFQYINNGGHERLTAKGPLRNELYVMVRKHALFVKMAHI